MTDPRHIPLAISKTAPAGPIQDRPYRTLICSPEGALWSMLGDPITGNPIATVSVPDAITNGSTALVTAAGVYGKALQAGNDELQSVDSINVTSAGISPSVNAFVGLGCASVPLLKNVTDSAFRPARGVAPDGWPFFIDATPDVQLTSGLGHAYDVINGLWVPLKSATATTLANQTGYGALMATSPGEWTLTSAPAAATVATATRAAGTAGVRHVLTSFCGDLNAVAAQAVPLEFVVRDGAAGVGTILYRRRLIAAAGSSNGFQITGLNVVGSAATAMTVEVTAAPAATNFATVSASGYSVAVPQPLP